MLVNPDYSKAHITIPRLELIAAYISADLVAIIQKALKYFNLRSIIAWSDKTVVLHWLREKASYKVFVADRDKKILEKRFTKYKYVPTNENPAEIGSRGCTINKLSKIWWKGFILISNPLGCSKEPHIGPTLEPQEESKILIEIVVTTIKKALIKFLKSLSCGKF